MSQTMTSLAAFADQCGRGLRQQSNVVFALLFKEFRSRASSGRLGVFWTVSSPMFSALIIATLWYLLGRKDFAGVSPYLVMTASIMPYQLVRRSLGSIPGAIAGNMNLYGYPQVKPIDALLARYVLDTTLTLLGGVILVLGLYWFVDIKPSFPDPLATLGLIGVTLVMNLGISLIVGVYGTLYDTFERVLGFVTRPLIFISLVFHLGMQLPEQARYWASWNPLADINEFVRYYMLGLPPMPEATLGYPLLVAILLLAFGMITYYAHRHRILLTE